ncbi:Phage protein [Lactococcus cremoris]|nr:Phage protein [Lactococcus cremoris]
MQAINHDYGLQIASGIFDEYVAMGGNHYAHEIYERYKKEKEK